MIMQLNSCLISITHMLLPLLLLLLHRTEYAAVAVNFLNKRDFHNWWNSLGKNENDEGWVENYISDI